MILPEDRRETMMRAIMTSTNASMKDGIDKMLAGQKLNEKQRSILSGFMERYTQESQDVVIAFLPELLDAMAKAYARQFSMQQLNDLKAFFSTPTGRIYMERSPAIMADPDVAAVQSRMMQMTMGRLPAAMKEMSDEMKQAGLAKE